MKRLLLCLPILAGCSGAQLREKQARLEECHVEQGKLRVEARDLKARLSALEDAESRSAELAARLQAAESRVMELEKSNRDLSSSSSFNQSQLQGRVRELVVEKDELSKKLAESQKNAAVTQRKLTMAASAKDKAEKELAALRKEKAEAEKAAAEEQDRKAAEARKVQDQAKELAGPIYDAVLKEIQAETAQVLLSDGGEIAVTLAESALFEPQTAKLTEAGASLLDRLAKASPAGRQAFVEAHTDSTPLKRVLLGGFHTHLELTSAQAAEVAGRLKAKAAVGRGQSGTGRKIVIKF